jgi:hypothetical protein
MNSKGHGRKRSWRDYYPVICLEGLRNTAKYVSQRSQCPDRDANRSPPGHKSEALPLETSCSVIWLLSFHLRHVGFICIKSVHSHSNKSVLMETDFDRGITAWGCGIRRSSVTVEWPALPLMTAYEYFPMSLCWSSCLQPNSRREHQLSDWLNGNDWLLGASLSLTVCSVSVGQIPGCCETWKRSFLYSQTYATCIYREPVESSPSTLISSGLLSFGLCSLFNIRRTCSC